MREYNLNQLEKVYSTLKEYAPVVGVCTLLLLSVVASGAIFTQPVGENQSGTVEAKPLTIDSLFIANGNNFGAVDQSDGSILWTYNHTSGTDDYHDIEVGGESGNVYALDASDGRVDVVDQSGNFVESFVISPNANTNGDSYTYDMVVDESNSTIYFGRGSDAEAVRNGVHINKYDMSTDTQTYEVRHSTGGALAVPLDMTNGRLYMVDRNNDRILEIEKSDGSIIRQTGGYFDNLRASNGSIYAASRTDGRLYKLDGDLTEMWYTGYTDAVAAGANDNYAFAGATAGNAGYASFETSGAKRYEKLDRTIFTMTPTFDGQYMVGTGTGTTVFDPETGDVIWSNGFGSGDSNMAGVASGYYSYTPPETVTDPQLEIETRNYIPHGNSTPYTVYYTDPITGNTNDVSDASGLTVNSSNTSVFTLDRTNNLVVATSDTSINQREQFTAEYEGLTQSENVTVANATVENLAILPGITRVQATYTDSNIVLILVGTMLGVLATRVASAFAGIGVLQLTLVSGFFVDLVSLGLVLVCLFASLFIGLNMAANIDYTVRR